MHIGKAVADQSHVTIPKGPEEVHTPKRKQIMHERNQISNDVPKKNKAEFFRGGAQVAVSVSPPHSFVSFAGHCNPKLLAYNQRRRRHLTCHLKEVTEQMGCSHSCFTRYRNDGLMTSPQQHKESTKRVLAEHTLNF